MNSASTMARVIACYFQQRGRTLVLLLLGGDKSTQSRDIETAKSLAKEY